MNNFKELYIKAKFLNAENENYWNYFFNMPNLLIGFYYNKKLTKKYRIPFSYNICVLWIPKSLKTIDVYELNNMNKKYKISINKFKELLEDKKYKDSIDINYVKNVPKKIENFDIENLDDLND